MVKFILDNHYLIGYIILLCLWIITIIYMCNIVGKDALKSLIKKAEYIFDWEGSGKDKLKYVVDKYKDIVPAPYKWFVDLKIIERLVEVLQPEFKDEYEERRKNKKK